VELTQRLILPSLRDLLVGGLSENSAFYSGGLAIPFLICLTLKHHDIEVQLTAEVAEGAIVSNNQTFYIMLVRVSSCRQYAGCR
jgi:hypothetical protein